MSQVLNSQYLDDLTYVVDCLVESKVYSPWKERLFDQILQNVEVSGFRKGKAPRKLALQQINPLAAEETILREAISKFGSEIVPDVKQKLQDEKRVVQSQTADIDPENTKSTDKGFQFRIIFTLLPQVDLEAIEKIKPVKVADKDMPERLAKVDFVSREQKNFLNTFNEYEEGAKEVTENSRVVVDVLEKVKDKNPNDLKDVNYSLGVKQLPPEFESEIIGLKVGETKSFTLKLAVPNQKKTVPGEYTVTIKKISNPKYTTLDEVFTNISEAKKQFPSAKEFEDFLNNYYDQETEVIRQDVERQKMIKEILVKIPDFTLPQEKVEAEQNRILKALQEQAKASGQSLGELWLASGFSETKDTVLETEKEVKKEIDIYVLREFKWVYILRTVYESKIEPKITTEEIHALGHDMEKRPEEYQISPNLSHEELDDVAFDRIMRNKSSNWLFSQIKKD